MGGSDVLGILLDGGIRSALKGRKRLDQRSFISDAVRLRYCFHAVWVGRLYDLCRWEGSLLYLWPVPIFFISRVLRDLLLKIEITHGRPDRSQCSFGVRFTPVLPTLRGQICVIPLWSISQHSRTAFSKLEFSNPRTGKGNYQNELKKI